MAQPSVSFCFVGLGNAFKNILEIFNFYYTEHMFLW
jgi:hypothetical protein